eukprot:m.109312 g.109312  ORF g.109312 m.109312 type:complete len:364 (-) comp15242_c0_seq4:3417-4508(-)
MQGPHYSFRLRETFMLLCLCYCILASAKKTQPTRDITPYNLAELCPLVPGHDRPSPRLLNYIRWLHAPKTGTSFGTCLIHYACPKLPGSIYPHKVSITEMRANNSGANPSEYMRYFLDTYKTKEYCPGDVVLRKMWGHKTLEPSEIQKGGIVGMFRDPRIRDYSEYLVHGHIGSNRHPRDLGQYVEMYRGCQTKFLLSKPCNRPKDPQYWFFNATREDLEQAISVLRSDKIAFVGLTEYWRESICLFHAMFGGNITEHEFTNSRPGVQGKASTQEMEEHPGLKLIAAEEDPADWEIYKVAKEIFVRRLVEYGIQLPTSLLRSSMSVNEAPVFTSSSSDDDDDDNPEEENDDDDDDDDDETGLQ